MYLFLFPVFRNQATRSDCWLKDRYMTNNPFHPRFTEPRDFDARNHVFPHSFSRRELPHFLVTDKQVDPSFSVFPGSFLFFFNSLGVSFWMVLHWVLYGISNTHPAYVNPISGHHKAVVFMSNRQACIIHEKPVVKCTSSGWQICCILGLPCLWPPLIVYCSI